MVFDEIFGDRADPPRHQQAQALPPLEIQHDAGGHGTQGAAAWQPHSDGHVETGQLGLCCANQLFHARILAT
jgi:hypothetical protein